MTSKIIFTLLGLVLTLAPGYGQKPENSSELVIKKLERELEAALLKNDSATLDRLLADDYIQIDARGTLKNKSEVIAAARTMSAVSRGVALGPTRTVDQLTIRLHGDSALVVGRTTISYQFMENQTSSSQAPSQNPQTADQERFMRAYSKVKGTWQLVAWQTTSIARS